MFLKKADNNDNNRRAFKFNICIYASSLTLSCSISPPSAPFLHFQAEKNKKKKGEKKQQHRNSKINN